MKTKQQKNLTHPNGMHLYYSPVMQAWLLLWGNENPLKCQVLRVFTSYAEGKTEFERCTSPS